MMDFPDYDETIVKPTIADFERQPTCVRYAFQACVVTFHMIDYYAYPKKSSGIRQKFQKMSREFSHIERVAHAFKHVITGNPEDKLNQPLASGEVISPPPGFAGIMLANISRVGDTVGGVTLISDAQLDLLTTVKNAAEFIRRQRNEDKSVEQNGSPAAGPGNFSTGASAAQADLPRSGP
jgi:hypothetical protein